MRRVLVVVTVLLALLWQSIALAPAGSTVNALVDAEHTSLHWHDAAHHHHDDGTYVLDDSAESSKHLLCDHLCMTAALPSAGPVAFTPAGSPAPLDWHTTQVPDPPNLGLLKPPRATV